MRKLYPKNRKKSKPISEETRLKMRLAKLGRPLSEIQKKNIGIAHSKIKHPWMKGFFKGRKHSEESKKIMSEVRLGKKLPESTVLKMKQLTGEKRYNYITDRTKLVVSDKKHLDGRYRDWMKAVKNRDGWKCQISNGDCSGQLEAHHILPWRDYPELRYQVNNGITLCCFHHPRKRSEEKRLSPYFQEMVNSKMN